MEVKAYFLRRIQVGHTSCGAIRKLSQNIVKGRILGRKPKLYTDENMVCIRWGCTGEVPQKNVLNTAKAISLVNDKKESRILFAEHKLAPETWGSVAEWQKDKTLPVIVRPAVHAQGRNLWMCNSEAEVIAATNKCPRGFYISRFINKEAEYRVFVAQGRAVWVAKKTPGNPDDIAWNVARGGRFDNVRWEDWPLGVVRTAIEAFNLTKLDFGGVDVMVQGKDYHVLEINSAPSQTSPYRQECCAKVFDWMIVNGKKPLPLVPDKGGYLKFIHPALDNKAKMVNA